ncbi:GNAT family N-acetyltransferase [Enterobacter sp. Bisph1]|uniref:GNAT family N-acetyltransferase n=1 Tax=Enterobacter sp. Bisph1 TaxID=1274399 RepID=UPI00057C12D0|nr:GNAT family N-acetyltransferase [Enterobacter sp. Bisph1]
MGILTISFTDANDPDCLAMQDALSDYLLHLTGSTGRTPFDGNALGERGFFLLARENGVAVGCVALRTLSAETGEVKRLYARPGTRLVGKQLLQTLEHHARARGFQQLWLETRKTNQRAVAFYLRNGYQVRENYGNYIGRPGAMCFEKKLRTDE